MSSGRPKQDLLQECVSRGCVLRRRIARVESNGREFLRNKSIRFYYLQYMYYVYKQSMQIKRRTPRLM